MQNNTTLIVTPDNLASVRMFEKAYRDIYLPAFPDVQEQESLEKLLDILHHPRKDYEVVLLVAGSNLDQPEQAVLKGMAVSFYYKKYRAAVLSYNAVAPEGRMQGIGEMLVRARIERLKELSKRDGQSLDCVVIELDNPAAPVKDPGKSAAKIRLFQKWGARLIDCDYIQPPLEPGKLPCPNMFLMAYPVDGVYPDNRAVMQYVRGIYEETLGRDYEQNPDFKYIQKQLES